MGSDAGLKTVVLLGSTGSGKSWLGNLLVDPLKARTLRPAQQFFPTSRSPLPFTKVPKWQAPSDASDVLVIDTPGFDESERADAEHMLNIVEKLRSGGHIAAVAFVTRDIRFADNVKRLLKLVSKIFPHEALEQNLVVVLNGQLPYPPDQYTAEDQAEDVAVVQTEVKELLGLQHNPIVMDFPQIISGAEWEVAVRHRDALLAVVRDRPMTDVSCIRFVKLPSMIAVDKERARRLGAEQQELLDSMKRDSPEAEHAAQRIAVLREEISGWNTTKQAAEADLEDKTGDEPFVNGRGFGYKSCTWTDALKVEAHSKGGHEVVKHMVHKRDCTDKTFGDGHSGSMGWAYFKAATPLIGRTGGEVEVYTTKNIIYRQQIPHIESAIATARAAIEKCDEKIAKELDHSETLKAQYSAKLQKMLDDKEEEKQRLLDDRIDIDHITVALLEAYMHEAKQSA